LRPDLNLAIVTDALRLVLEKPFPCFLTFPMLSSQTNSLANGLLWLRDWRRRFKAWWEYF